MTSQNSTMWRKKCGAKNSLIPKACKRSAANLLLNLVYTMDDPEEKRNIFNELIVNFLNEHKNQDFKTHHTVVRGAEYQYTSATMT